MTRMYLPRTPAAYPNLWNMKFSAVRYRQCVRQLGRLPTIGPVQQLLLGWVASRLHPQFMMHIQREEVEERQEKPKKVEHPGKLAIDDEDSDGIALSSSPTIQPRQDRQI